MKSRVIDVMGDALGMVRNSDLGGATALIRKALSGEGANGPRAIRAFSRSLHQFPPSRPRRGVGWARFCALFAPGRRSRPAPPRLNRSGPASSTNNS